MKRDLTSFFCKELLPAYLEGTLDKERKKAVEDVLSKNGDLKHLFQQMKLQMEFLDELSAVTPKPELISFIEKPTSSMRELTKKYGWSQWSSAAQWSVQLAFVGIMVVVTVRYVPWLNLARTLQSSKPSAPQLRHVTPVEETIDVLKPRPIFGPEWPKNFPTPELYAKKMEESKKKNQAIADIVAKTDEETGLQSSNIADEGEESQPQREGFVWRGTLKVDQLDDATAGQVTEVVEGLGGKKAGQVELGWKKGESRYYHFTLPEGNYTGFEQQIGDIGQLTLKKEKHPRVMPEGIMRIIMSVEEGK